MAAISSLRGSISPFAAPLVMRTGPVTAQVHGQDGLGIVHATLAMEVAIEMARESGVGIVGVGHSSHCGAVGLYTRMAAKEAAKGPLVPLRQLTRRHFAVVRTSSAGAES